MRLPFTLLRHITGDLFKLVALTAGVLVTVIAFGAAIQPISDGVLDAAGALKYITLAIPPMLAYALPFAGGFAATLVYHRLSTDLEAMAAYASGISHRVLLAPALALALGCTTLLVALNEEIIPAFLREMQRLVTVDVAKLIAQRIGRGESVTFENMMIHADGVRQITPDPGSGILDQLYLTHFGAISLAEGEPTDEVTAQSARIWLLPGESSGTDASSGSTTRLVMRLENVVYAQRAGPIAGFKDYLDFAILVPNAFRDNVKFMNWRELARLKDNPERLNWVDARRRDLAAALAEQTALNEMAAGVTQRGTLELVDELGSAVTVRARAMERREVGWELLGAPGQRVETSLVRVSPSSVDRGAPEVRTPMIVAAQRAYLKPAPGPAGLVRPLVFRLELEQARSRGAGLPESDANPERALVPVDGLSPARNPAPAYLAASPAELLNLAAPVVARPVPDAAVFTADKALRSVLGRLTNDVLAKRNERMALALSCAVMIVTGAVTALKFSRRLPLTVYLFTFFPALACMVTISGGQQITVKQGWPGLILMWSGVAALGCYTLLVFGRLKRH